MFAGGADGQQTASTGLRMSATWPGEPCMHCACLTNITHHPHSHATTILYTAMPHVSWLEWRGGCPLAVISWQSGIHTCGLRFCMQAEEQPQDSEEQAEASSDGLTSPSESSPLDSVIMHAADLGGIHVQGTTMGHHTGHLDRSSTTSQGLVTSRWVSSDARY